MRLKSLIRIVLLLLCFSGGVSAQSPADSAALANASWRTVYDADGMTVRKLSIRLFDSDQQISCIEIAPEKYRLAVIQDSLRTKTSRIGKQSGGVAAINGGFFKTRTKQAVAMGFIKTGGYRPAQIGAETGVAVAVDTAGVLRLIDWSLAMEQADAPHRDRYPDVMVTGPMLLRGGRSSIPWDSTAPRHPRSCVGTKADGTVLLMVVDGRQSRAAGMALCELAYAARLMGAADAINLDGGGSSTLWTKGQGIVNAPSDRMLFFRSERPVCNAIVVKRK